MSGWVAVAVWAQARNQDPVWLGLALDSDAKGLIHSSRDRIETLFPGRPQDNCAANVDVLVPAFEVGTAPECQPGHPPRTPVRAAGTGADARAGQRTAFPLRGSRTRPPGRHEQRGSRSGAARRRRGPSSPVGRALRLHTASDRRRVPGRAVCAGREKRGGRW